MPGTWARSQAEHHRFARTCTHSDREPKDRAPHLGSLGPRRVSITEARQPVNRGTRPDDKHDLDFDRGTAAWGRTMPGTWARSQTEHHRFARTCTHSDREPKDGAPHLGSLGPRTASITEARQPVNRGTRPARPGFRPRDRSLGAHHARHMGTIPGTSITEFPTHARQLIGILGSGHLTWDHLDLEGAPSPKQGNQSPDAHDRKACMA